MKSLVTGAGRGIGRAIALQLASDGYDVALHANASIEAVAETKSAIEAMGRKALVVSADFANLGATRGAVRTIHERWGCLDTVVLSAGLSSGLSLFDITDDDINLVIDVNLKAPLVLAQETMKAMRDSNVRGNVIIIGSAAGQTGGALVGPHYVAAKGGTHALIKSLAKAGAPLGIRVNGVAPGFVGTGGLDKMKERNGVTLEELVPIGRIGKVDEIARCVSFLASEAASYIDGALIDVNGGIFMRQGNRMNAKRR